MGKKEKKSIMMLEKRGAKHERSLTEDSHVTFSILHIPDTIIKILFYLQASKPEKVLPVNSLKLYLGVKKKMKPPTK